MGGGATTSYYDTEIKTPELGNYAFEIEAHEKPSHETLPIISKDYFPMTVARFTTEVDNTPPSATYAAKPITKVDVVFALGELSQMSQLESYMPTFEAKLKSAANNLDAQITSVETVTGGFDMADADANTIYNFWEQCPNPNNFILQGNKIVNAIWAWNGYPAKWRTNTPFNHFFIESESWDVTDFELSSTYAWHGCGVPSGYVFRYDKSKDTCYILLVGSQVELYKVWNVRSWLGQNTVETGGNAQYNEVYLGHNNGHGLRNVSKLTGATVGYATSGDGENLTLKVKGNKIEVFKGNSQVLTYTDPNALVSGGVGLFAGCTVSFSDVSLAYEKTVRKSLGESISDVAWRDNAVRFIIHATDVVPSDMASPSSADYQYTVTKLYNSNAYLINLGTGVNKVVLDRLVKDISGTDGELKGTFFYNNPVSTALNSSASYILEKVKNLAKPTSYILVNTEIVWDTLYNDSERDLPLNFGKNKADAQLASAWGVGLTDLYRADKLLAEKWRYRHDPFKYDNSTITATFNSIWIPDPVNVFTETGLYRVNYKRRDNPFKDANISNVFDNYRYWSTDYDMRKAG